MKTVVVHNIISDEVEIDTYEVYGFEVVYDKEGVLIIDAIIDPPNIRIVFYGPGTWKYIACYEEPDDKEE